MSKRVVKFSIDYSVYSITVGSYSSHAILLLHTDTEKTYTFITTHMLVLLLKLAVVTSRIPGPS